MYWNRFDIVEAYYLALMDCHGGQWSNEYARLCKIKRYFKPGAMFSERSLNDNAREIYNNVCQRLLAK